MKFKAEKRKSMKSKLVLLKINKINKNGGNSFQLFRGQKYPDIKIRQKITRK